jgi:hypothetical protein
MGGIGGTSMDAGWRISSGTPNPNVLDDGLCGSCCMRYGMHSESK